MGMAPEQWLISCGSGGCSWPSSLMRGDLCWWTGCSLSSGTRLWRWSALRRRCVSLLLFQGKCYRNSKGTNFAVITSGTN